MKDNYAKVNNNKWASDDDASDLLAGILDETEDEAIAEQQRLDAELRAKQEREKQALVSAEENRKREAADKLSAEMNRLEGVKQKRTEKLQAIQVEELKARGEWVDPEEERRKVEALRQQEIDKARSAAEHQAAIAAASAVPEGSVRMPTSGSAAKSKLPLIIMGILGVLVIAGGVGGSILMGGYSADNTSYAKAVFAPKTPETNLVEKSFMPTPKKKRAAAVADDSSPSRKSKSRRSKSRRSKSRVAKTDRKKSKKKSRSITSKPKKNGAANALEKALKNNNVYGSDPF